MTIQVLIVNYRLSMLAQVMRKIYVYHCISQFWQLLWISLIAFYLILFKLEKRELSINTIEPIPTYSGLHLPALS